MSSWAARIRTWSRRLQQAKADGALVGRFEVDALPEAGPAYDRVAASAKAEGEDATESETDSQRAPLEVATPLPELVRPTAVKSKQQGVESQGARSSAGCCTLAPRLPDPKLPDSSMLKALELSGFKSFADRTRFEFPQRHLASSSGRMDPANRTSSTP